MNLFYKIKKSNNMSIIALIDYFESDGTKAEFCERNNLDAESEAKYKNFRS